MKLMGFHFQLYVNTNYQERIVTIILRKHLQPSPVSFRIKTSFENRFFYDSSPESDFDVQVFCVRTASSLKNPIFQFSSF